MVDESAYKEYHIALQVGNTPVKYLKIQSLPNSDFIVKTISGDGISLSMRIASHGVKNEPFTIIELQFPINKTSLELSIITKTQSLEWLATGKLNEDDKFESLEISEVRVVE